MNNTTRRPLARWWLLLAILPATAIATPLSLPQALAAAERYSAELSASKHQVNALENMADAATQLPDPKLQFGIENVPVSGNNSRRFTREGMTMQRIGIMQEYVSSDKRQRKADTLRAESRQTAASQQTIRARLQRDVAQAWIELALSEKTVQQANTLVTESQRQISVQRASVGSGSALPASVLDARLTLVAMQDRLTEAERDASMAKTRLTQLTGVDNSQIQGPLPHIERLPADEKTLFDTITLHPEVLQARREADVAQAKSSQSAIAAIPDVGVEVYYGRRADEYEDLAGIMFTVDLPLFTASRQDKDHAADRSRAMESNDRLTLLLREHQAQLSTLLAQYQAAQTLWQRQKTEVLPLQKQRLEVLQAQYRAGKSDLASILDARRGLLESQLAVSSAERDVARLWTALRYLTPQENVL
jgi:outer membrane protein TolC